KVQQLRIKRTGRPGSLSVQAAGLQSRFCQTSQFSVSAAPSAGTSLTAGVSLAAGTSASPVTLESGTSPVAVVFDPSIGIPVSGVPKSTSISVEVSGSACSG